MRRDEIRHCYLIRSLLRTPAPTERMAKRVEVNRVIEHLHGRLDDQVTIETLAQVAHLSPSHFARVFRKETGKAPMEFVQGLRLERAKKLLLAGDKSITDIALECGFGTPSYLSANHRAKRGRHGLLTQYRIKLLQNVLWNGLHTFLPKSAIPN